MSKLPKKYVCMIRMYLEMKKPISMASFHLMKKNFKKMFAIKTMGPIKRLLSKMQESFLQKVPKKCWKKCTMWISLCLIEGICATFLIHFCMTFAREKCEIDPKKCKIFSKKCEILQKMETNTKISQKIENFKKQLQKFYKNIFAFSQNLWEIFAFLRIFLSKFCNKVCKMRSKIFTFFEKIFVCWKP